MRAAFVILGALLVARAARANTLVTFDDLPIGTPVNTQYLSLGLNGQTISGAVYFNGVAGFPGAGPHISNDAAPHSGGNVLINNPFAVEFGDGPVTFQFTIPQKTVQLFGGFVFTAGAPTRSATLSGYAFDSSGNVIPTAVAVDGPRTITGGQAATLFSISSTTANISKVVFDAGISNAVIDDLQFDGGGGSTGVPEPPTITLQDPDPASGILDYVHNPLVIDGIATGLGLLPTVSVTVSLVTPPPLGGFPEANGVMPLIASLPQSFANYLPGAIGVPNMTLPIGTYTVVVRATDLIGQVATAWTQFLNFPPLLFDETPEVTAQLGAFRFAQPTGACQMVVFEGGAAAYFPASAGVPEHRTLVPQAVIGKWLDIEINPNEETRLRNATIIRGDGTLGCPLGDAVSMTIGVNAVYVQDFDRGRIYTVGTAAAYTPTVLVNAITALATLAPAGAPVALTNFNDMYQGHALGIHEIGIPCGDPAQIGTPCRDPDYDLADQDPTWLFQQFSRPGAATVASTLEIRGQLTNPKLYVERVGGSLTDFRAASAGATDPSSTTATVWETFDCPYQSQTGQFQCNVARPPVRGALSSFVPMYSSEPEIANYNQYCDAAVVPFTCKALGVVVGQTSWSAVPGKTGNLAAEPTDSDFTDVLTKGWIRRSGPSDIDLPLDHNHMHYRATGDLLNFLSVAVPCPAGLCGLGNYLLHEEAGNFGWSDWVLHIRPLALGGGVDPNAGLLSLPRISTPPVPPFWNLLAANGDPNEQGAKCPPELADMESEWEADWWPSTTLDGLHKPETDQNHWYPKTGDLMILNGRWIVDCGHPDYHSEIHPPNTIIRIDALPFAINGAPGPAPIVTRAQIWINDFYGGSPFQTTVWPPPRPSASARLTTAYVSFNPTVTNADGSLSSSFFNVPVEFGPWPDASVATMKFAPDGVNMTVSGPPGHHKIKGTGQVMRPGDDPSYGSGAAGNFLALLYVGWNQ